MGGEKNYSSIQCPGLAGSPGSVALCGQRRLDGQLRRLVRRLDMVWGMDLVWRLDVVWGMDLVWRLDLVWGVDLVWLIYSAIIPITDRITAIAHAIAVIYYRVVDER
jgi:hypothetical protein